MNTTIPECLTRTAQDDHASAGTVSTPLRCYGCDLEATYHTGGGAAPEIGACLHHAQTADVPFAEWTLLEDVA